MPVVIGLGVVEPALVLAVQLPTSAWSTGSLLDLGIIDKPVVWFGEDADRSLWAVIVSVVWKVIGFGMILFVAAIQAIPQRDQRGGHGRRRQLLAAGRAGSPCR